MINTESDYAWLRVVALELVAEGNLKAADAMAQQVKDAEQRWLDSFERWLQVTGDKKGLARMRARNTAPFAPGASCRFTPTVANDGWVRSRWSTTRLRYYGGGCRFPRRPGRIRFISHDNFGPPAEWCNPISHDSFVILTDGECGIKRRARRSAPRPREV